MPERVPNPEAQMSMEDLDRNARTLFETIRLDGEQEARRYYIEETFSEAKRDQAEIILDAPRIRELEFKKNTSRIEESEFDELIGYNHKVRDLVAHNQVDLDKVEGWLAQAVGDETWARGIRNGVAGEVALFRALQNDAVVQWVRFGTIEEDKKKMDLVAGVPDGRGGTKVLGIDVKSHHHLYDNEVFERLSPIRVEQHGPRYERVRVGLKSDYISPGAQLNELAHGSQLRQLENYALEMGQTAKAA